MKRKLNLLLVLVLCLGLVGCGKSTDDVEVIEDTESIYIDTFSKVLTIDINDTISFETTIDLIDKDNENIEIIIENVSIINGKYKNGEVTITSNNMVK